MFAAPVGDPITPRNSHFVSELIPPGGTVGDGLMDRIVKAEE